MTPVVGTLIAKPYTEVDARIDLHDSQDRHGALIQDFSRLFYHAPHTWGITLYRGVPVMKAPTDLWMYHECIHALKPSLIVETGTAYGGSAAFFADQIDTAGGGRVISVDIEGQPNLPTRKNLTYWHGASSVAPSVLACLREAAVGQRVMVVLDSNHHTDHVVDELDAYAPLVSVGQLLVVEDTNISDPAFMGKPIAGPGQALAEWLPLHHEFVRETLCERFLLTFSPGGWLMRVA